MKFFKIFKSSSENSGKIPNNEQEAKQKLIEMSCFGLGKQPNKDEMIHLILNTEANFADSMSYELEYWLGIALRNYTAWFVRGSERKDYLQKALQHLEISYQLSGGVIKENIIKSKKSSLDSDSIDRNLIAGEIGILYVNEAVIRDLDKGIFYLGKIYEITNDYYPHLCSYAETFYKVGDYKKSAKIALDLKSRAEVMCKKEGWAEIPPAIMKIIEKSYRSQAKKSKKEGDIDQAIFYFQKLVNLNLASDNDTKILELLKG